MPFKRVPRLTAFDYSGLYRYSLTICTAGRATLFVTDEAISLVLLELSRTSDAEQFAVIAYCFMPDHLPALVEGTRDDCDFRRLARVFKQQSSFQWKQRMRGELWQRSYFDHVLRDDEDVFAVARYILNNPVRAGLVKSPEVYPFLGSLTMNVRDLWYSVQIDHRPT
jgi:putative transposase